MMKKLVMVMMLIGTPAWAGGSMASDVRVIRVSPSITSYGIVREIQKRQEFEYKETYKLNGKMALEDQKFQQKRQLEADRAYYKKLADQRKARKK
jgi:exopolysaccharide biosynthesis protein